jgi:rubrerythrin
MADEITLEQAARNAIDAEVAAEGFYTLLAGEAAEAQVREFFALMAEQERQHATRIRALAVQLGAGQLPDEPDTEVASIETCMGWEGRAEISFREAVELALCAENGAGETYEAWAEQLEGVTAELFLALAADEARHAMLLQQVLDTSSLDELERSLALPQS